MTYRFAIGDLARGTGNAITDVPGVLVGHATLDQGDLRTGVTAILPHAEDLFRAKVPGAVHVINGFGKSAGLMQLEELGQVETPILLTNTLSVPACSEALIRRAIAANPAIGRRTGTVNAIVGECNDGFLNDIQSLAVTPDHASAAIESAGTAFARGAIGAGTGMSCFGFKGGIGTASRALELDGKTYHFGVLVLSNFGRAGDLRLPDGRRIAPPDAAASIPVERGSVIIVTATDIPLDHRQLQRVIRRAGVGLARLGAFWGHGSGDVAIGFTTAWRIRHDETGDLIPIQMLNENRIDLLFQAMADTTQEAVLDSMLCSKAMAGRNGHFRPSLADHLG